MAAEASETSSSVWYVDIDDEAGTASLAADVASLVKPGDLVTLSGRTPVPARPRSPAR